MEEFLIGFTSTYLVNDLKLTELKMPKLKHLYAGAKSINGIDEFSKGFYPQLERLELFFKSTLNSMP